MPDKIIDFRTHPDEYHHWRITVDGAIATLTMDVTENASLIDGYELKLNSYDLGVDIELADAVQRLRFEYPAVKTVVLTSGKERLFCAGANIRMLARASHGHKVNFCKFTNETRNAIEDASTHSGQRYLCAINGPAAGGGYELAMASDYLLMIDDGSTNVSLPELPLLAVLPGTGGLTRLVDKRYVRRDHADFFCTTEEGLRGKKALAWRLVDELAPPSRFADAVHNKAQQLALLSDRPSEQKGIELTTVQRELHDDSIVYQHMDVSLARDTHTVIITLHGPDKNVPADIETACTEGADFWPLALARELDDCLLHLRANEPQLGTLVFKSSGEISQVLAYDGFLQSQHKHWLMREIALYWKRVLNRLDTTSRSLFALLEPGSCFAGILLEIVLAADRSFMLDGQFEGDNRAPAAVALSTMNFGPMTTVNGMTRLQTRYLDAPERLAELNDLLGEPLLADEAEQQRLVTFIPDDIDWQEEVRIALEERASFSPDALTGLEASLRFAGQESLFSKIFARLSAWQNWIFQRPNAVGKQGALQLYGSGQRSEFNRERI